MYPWILQSTIGLKQFKGILCHQFVQTIGLLSSFSVGVLTIWYFRLLAMQVLNPPEICQAQVVSTKKHTYPWQSHQGRGFFTFWAILVYCAERGWINSFLPIVVNWHTSSFASQIYLPKAFKIISMQALKTNDNVFFKDTK